MTAPMQVPLRGRTVGEIAAEVPGATEVLRKFNMDCCCGGDLVIGEAARARGIDIAEVERALDALLTPEHQATATLETGALIDHILARYHETHRREVPELIRLARKVEAVHATHPKVPRGLADTLQAMLGELEVHMKKEELILFPAMRRRSGGGGLNAPITQMRHDHDDRPAGACRSWQALYAGSVKFASDLVEHLHLKNDVLFPRFEDAPQT